LPAPSVGSAQAPAAAEALLQEGKRLFDAFQYEQAMPLFDRAISLLPATSADLLVQAYELRARARFALGDNAGTERDFASLLALRPGFALSQSISPRVVAIFGSVKRQTVGQLAVSLTPAGDVVIDGAPFTAEQITQGVDLIGGEHVLTASRPGYRSASERFTIKPGERIELRVAMERVSATLSVATVPDGVEVLINGIARGVTPPGDGLSETSGMLTIEDLPPGVHRLQFRRDCFATLERQITVQQPDDLSTDPIRLTPATATARIEGDQAETDTTIYVDGKPRGPAPAEITDVCAGPHVIEVRSPRGRFVDRREWRTGDSVTLKARVRPAFALVTAQAAGGASSADVAAEVERALAPADGALIFVPPQKDLEGALAQANAPAEWLSIDPESGAAALRARRDARRDIGRSLAERLEVQGIATVTTGKTPDEVALILLASGSAEPEVLRFSLADQASKDRALATLNTKFPPVVRPALEASVVDLAHQPGAAVVRSQGVAAAAGLSVGDVIVGAGGSPVQTVADLRLRVSAARPQDSLALTVRNAAGAERAVNVSLAAAADTVPLRDPGLVYNQFLADLQSLARTTRDPFAQSATRLNLAIVQLRLGNPDEALKTLQEVTLPDGPGVSSATVTYLTGLAFEALGRTADARAAFTRAAATTQGRLSADGPTIASMAATRLKTARP
jgi:tetratricopeptide (TPR) repeat protein